MKPKKYKMTKEQVRNAVLVEPLKAGAFTQDGTENCQVCAVGAILRHSIHKAFGPEHGFDLCKNGYSFKSEDELDGVYKSNDFFSILSCEFENAHKIAFKEMDYELLKMHALMIVEAMCPNVLKFEAYQYE